MRISTGEADTIVRAGSPEAGVILEVEGYSGGFVSAGAVEPVLHDVSFAVRRSTITALVGETGSGKTITALSILGITPSTFRRSAGSIVFEGRDLVACDESELRSVRGSRIAMVFQDARAALNPVFTIGRQLADVHRLHHGSGKEEAREATAQALARVRIPDAAGCMRRYPHELSGGMAQRAQLAMALIAGPSLLILDEPTTGLDVTIQADILELLVDLIHQAGMTTLLITHDLGVVAETCDDIVVMRHGRVCETGPCERLVTAPSHPYTQALLDASRFQGV